MFADSDVYAGAFVVGAADVAEWVVLSEPAEPGDVVELDLNAPGRYRPTSRVCSDLVAGVISTDPGVILGQDGTSGLRARLALTGIVPVRVTDEGGPILPGDLLVASSRPGYAMRCPVEDACPCVLVGKALEPMTSGEEGLILVLLMAH